jgi:hypothetical protein
MFQHHAALPSYSRKRSCAADDDTIDYLAGAGLDVFAMDVTGYGLTKPKADDGRSLQQFNL